MNPDDKKFIACIGIFAVILIGGYVSLISYTGFSTPFSVVMSQSMQHDDFACFNDEKYADTKLVFDMPLEEFCFLQSCGRVIKGKVDSKYLVGCIENVNAQNVNLRMPISEIVKAEKISRANPPSDAEPNNITTLVNHLIMKFPKEKRGEKKKQIYGKMNNWKEEILDFFAEEKKRKTDFLFIKNQKNR